MSPEHDLHFRNVSLFKLTPNALAIDGLRCCLICGWPTPAVYLLCGTVDPADAIEIENFDDYQLCLVLAAARDLVGSNCEIPVCETHARTPRSH